MIITDLCTLYSGTGKDYGAEGGSDLEHKVRSAGLSLPASTMHDAAVWLAKSVKVETTCHKFV